MQARDAVSKAKSRLAVVLLVYLGIGAAFLAAGVWMLLKQQAKNMTPVPVQGSLRAAQEGQAVSIESETMPVFLPASGEERLYLVKDMGGRNVYIAQMDDSTFQGILALLDAKTGRLTESYTLTGVAAPIDKSARAAALSGGAVLFPGGELDAAHFSELLGECYIRGTALDKYAGAVCTILVLCALLFAVIALGHILPALIRVSKGNFGAQDERRMVQALEKQLPQGEALEAGVYAAGLETCIKCIFQNCACDGSRLIPCTNGSAVCVSKSKYARHEVYAGVSQRYFVLCECEENKHFYEWEEVSGAQAAGAEPLNAELALCDIGACFPLTEIQSCAVKNAAAGSVICTIAMKNGSAFKIQLPKNSGPGMPRQAEYRETLLARLRP